jgi:hypothetical protein
MFAFLVKAGLLSRGLSCKVRESRCGRADAFERWPTGSGLRPIKNRVRSRDRSEGASSAGLTRQGCSLRADFTPRANIAWWLPATDCPVFSISQRHRSVVGLAMARTSRACLLEHAKAFTKARRVVHLSLRFSRVRREIAFGRYDAIGYGIPPAQRPPRATRSRYATAAIDLGFTIYSFRTALPASTSASDTSYPQRSARCWRTCLASVSCS